jgi:tagaturonate reductase
MGEVLQFGAGNFLRAFADLFMDEARKGGADIGPVTIIQSTDSSRAEAISRARGAYHVVLRGLRGGAVVDEVHAVDIVAGALNANTDWPGVLAKGLAPAVTHVVSNTTEAGLSLVEGDAFDGAPPRSFPAKMTRLLFERRAAGLPGWVILPCELVEANGDKVRDLVLEQARRWSLGEDFAAWLRSANHWPNSLVDRIVTGRPAAHPLLAEDPLLVAAEPYALWAIETGTEPFPLFDHPAIRVVADIRPYSLRKIRLLNGAHSALVCHALPMGFATVREAIEDPDIAQWLRGLLFEEVVPVLEGRVDAPREFAEQTLERFANPFLEHKLTDIALNHADKLRTRLLPTWREFRDRFSETPPRIDALLRQAVIEGTLAASELE